MVDNDAQFLSTYVKRSWLFSSSLTKTIFYWYSTLLVNSMLSWNDMQSKFHDQFYKTKSKVAMRDLVKVVHEPGELIKKYVTRLRIERTKCSIVMSKKDNVKLV